MKEFRFKSNPVNYEKESLDIKNNTIRLIDLSDERFTNFIAWNEFGYNDGDIKIKIVNSFDANQFFVRGIRDISLWENLMVITWNEENKVRR
jgi:hypothetical protein